jgi:hypothetical protein
VTIACFSDVPPVSAKALQLHRLPQGDPLSGYIYILLIDNGSERIPVYIGRAKDPIVRWSKHLAGLHSGERSYARWCKVLLTDEGMARYGLNLVVIPISEVKHAPLPNFPISAGAIEYQLIAIAGEAYPGWLLNHEGHRR